MIPIADLTDAQIHGKIIRSYRKAMKDKEELRSKQIPWHNQRCGRCECSAEMHSDTISCCGCGGFLWTEKNFEAADDANRKIEWEL
jgi:hypothetical protein